MSRMVAWAGGRQPSWAPCSPHVWKLLFLWKELPAHSALCWLRFNCFLPSPQERRRAMSASGCHGRGAVLPVAGTGLGRGCSQRPWLASSQASWS